MGADGDAELAFLDHLPGSIGNAIYHLRVWRHGEFRHSAGRESRFVRMSPANPYLAPVRAPPTEWFNPAAFATPPAFTYGNAGRNSVYGPPQQSLDLALARSFSLTERATFQFRAEAFNALNKTNLGTPNRFVNTPQFGTITMAMTPGRELQVSARLSF